MSDENTTSGLGCGIDFYKPSQSWLDAQKKWKSKYLAKISAMTDQELYRECQKQIYESAVHHNVPGDWSWRREACCDEAETRDGNRPNGIYDRALFSCRSKRMRRN